MDNVQIAKPYRFVIQRHGISMEKEEVEPRNPEDDDQCPLYGARGDRPHPRTFPWGIYVFPISPRTTSDPESTPMPPGSTVRGNLNQSRYRWTS